MSHFRCLQSFLCILAAVLPAFSQASSAVNETPTREFGHPRLSTPITTFAPNLVEGRELNGPSSMAIDTSSTPPIIYVADTFNNRVLAWRDPANLTKGNPAAKVIGQRDFVSTLAQSPGGSQGQNLSTGLSLPVSVAVDRNGNLYVSDAGNNRILRYPKPLEQTGDLLAVDLVIGQKSVNAGTLPNQGQTDSGGRTLPSAKTLFLASGGSLARNGMAFDAQGNLWLSDTFNYRVLRFPVAQLAANTVEPTADLVLGQLDFATGTPPGGAAAVRTNKAVLVQPAGIAFDAAGRLYVADGYARVLQYNAVLFGNGTPAARILGLPNVPPQGQNPTPTPNDRVLGNVTPFGQILGIPQTIVTFQNDVFVIDSPNHRLVHYAPPETWPAETENQPSPAMVSVVGQPDLFSNKVHRGLKEPTDQTLNTPLAAAFLGTDLWILDAGNNRVLAMPNDGALQYSRATRLLGQIDFAFMQPNLIEGRELFIAGGGVVAGGAAVDRRTDPPRLYVADTFNNRVLGFRDARNVKAGDQADLVIGQLDFSRAWTNYPNADPALPSDVGLNRPTGLAVDANGNLWVADNGNGRAIRFPSPFDQPPGTQHRANLVLGQSSFTTQLTDASSSNMRSTYGLALFSDGSLAVSDLVHNRVLIFRRPANGDFTNGQAAAVVLGQTDFSSSNPSLDPNRMNQPRHIATDTSDRLYVADFANNRVQVYSRANTATNGSLPGFTQSGLNQPMGIIVSARTGETYVTETGSNRFLKFPVFENWTLNPGVVVQSPAPTSQNPIVVTLDPFDNPIVLEAANRMTFYYAKLAFRNVFSHNKRAMTPGMVAYVFNNYGQNFTEQTSGGNLLPPWPKDVRDLQVLVNGTPAPIFRVENIAIYFQVPMSAPQSGTAEWQVVRKSTGQIFGVADVPMNVANPAFCTDGTGFGQVAALNEDGSRNAPGNGVQRGRFIALCLTGSGFISGAPADGEAPTAALATPVRPRVIVEGVPSFLPDSDIQYSGLGFGFPGLWQLNVRIPEAVPPNNAIQVLVTMYDIPSNQGGNPQGWNFPDVTIRTTIAVR
jgi:uncharacterized protein (TIGR03437 family)